MLRAEITARAADFGHACLEASRKYMLQLEMFKQTQNLSEASPLVEEYRNEVRQLVQDGLTQKSLHDGVLCSPGSNPTVFLSTSSINCIPSTLDEVNNRRDIRHEYKCIE